MIGSSNKWINQVLDKGSSKSFSSQVEDQGYIILDEVDEENYRDSYPISVFIEGVEVGRVMYNYTKRQEIDLTTFVSRIRNLTPIAEAISNADGIVDRYRLLGEGIDFLTASSPTKSRLRGEVD